MGIMRYLVKDVSESSEFYVRHFGFEVEAQYGDAVAILNKDDLTLWLAGPNSFAGQPMPDGTKPVPGGWNRIAFEVEDIEAAVATLRGKRNEVQK